MKNYIIEGGVDFFDELYKSLDTDDNQEKTEEDDNMCLISNQLLTDHFVKLNCGHKFNYIPLYKDILNHKTKFNQLESSKGLLKGNQLRCPYCRDIQHNLLPYYEDLGLEKVHGVNFYDPTSYTHSHTAYKKCEFLEPNQDFNPDKEENEMNKKMVKCCHYGSQIGSNDQILYNDQTYYCYSHKKQMLKKYKNELIQKAKDEMKKAKEDVKKAKDEVKKAKEEEKQKAKEEKEAAKKKKVKPNNENIILGPIIIDLTIDSDLCIEIIKSGSKKGSPCGCKLFNDNLCKRHYNLKNKDSVTK